MNGVGATAIRHVGITVSSVADAEEFYTKFLGFHVLADYPECSGPYYDALRNRQEIK